ncbi:DUF5926 family protein [Pseudokineococcus sp. 1T1Z-3]|uniref:DUF5926 family protein n=1 Tax=Pseudokineococcus sp. 1T1Z-3 TaxID=3132745 RepID=UPI0030B19C04
MAKRSARHPGSPATARAVATAEEVPVVGQREPCPCGSGRRYKMCHGRAARAAAAPAPARPFAGLPGEGDWVCLREVVPAATAALRTTPEHGGVDVTLATLLPLARPGLRRQDGERLLGLQTLGTSGDPSRDAAAALLAVLDLAPGEDLARRPEVTAATPRLQDVLDPSRPLEVRVHEGFDFWLDPGVDPQGPAAEALASANGSVVPTERLAGVEAAYWCRIGERTHLRWAFVEEEQQLLDALARLAAAGEAGLGDGTRLLGTFRTQGLLVPVWDLTPGAVADDVEEPAAAFRARLDEALAVTDPLTADERRARAGVVSRQLTLRG